MLTFYLFRAVTGPPWQGVIAKDYTFALRISKTMPSLATLSKELNLYVGIRSLATGQFVVTALYATFLIFSLHV